MLLTTGRVISTSVELWQEHPMTVGAHIRQAREARGLSIAAVSAATRIKPRLLEALERDDLSDLPPRPYARGFVAAFAREVGLNPEETVREYFDQFAPASPPPEVATPVIPANRMRVASWIPVVGGVAVVLLLAALVSNHTDEPSAAEPRAVGARGTPAASTGVAGTSGATAAAAVRAPTPPPPESAVVVLETTGPSWIAAVVDGNRELYRIVPAGTKTTLRGAREIVIRVGNAGVVRWSVNGREPQVMGASGEVRDAKVTPDS